MRVAIVGITGMVGSLMLKILEERKFPVTKFFAVASERSAGQKVTFKGVEYNIIQLEDLQKEKVDLALFSAGGEVSKNWGPILAEKGCKVIDNSSYWRMCSKHKLVVPEINGFVIEKDDKIIANPNCSTIQMLMPIAPLHKKYNVKRIVVSTYQAVSGTGVKAVEQLHQENNSELVNRVYPYAIYQNVIPHCDDFQENGYTKEEMKLTNETKKILDEKIQVSATAVRVPVVVGHSESVNISFDNPFELNEVRDILEGAPGVVIVDNPGEKKYPMPNSCEGKDDVFVGRIRRDFTQENTLNMWIVSDNLRKGAATNTIQIAEYLIKNKLI